MVYFNINPIIHSLERPILLHVCKQNLAFLTAHRTHEINDLRSKDDSCLSQSVIQDAVVDRLYHIVGLLLHADVTNVSGRFAQQKYAWWGPLSFGRAFRFISLLDTYSTLTRDECEVRVYIVICVSYVHLGTYNNTQLNVDDPVTPRSKIMSAYPSGFLQQTRFHASH